MKASSDLEILYEDNHLIAVIKPPGILSQEDESGAPDMVNLLKADLKKRYDKPGNVYVGLIHRLDRPVGGVMLFAKTSKAASRLSESVRSRQFEKYYIAITSGVPELRSGTLKHYLTKDSKTNTVSAFQSPQPNAKEAILDYRLIASSGNRSLVAVKLHTGRPHQIRVQMASIGCPLDGDRKYGRDDAAVRLDNPALWSASIGVLHPVTKDWLTFSSIPSSFSPWNQWSVDQLEMAAICFKNTP